MQDEFGAGSIYDNPLDYALRIGLDRTPALITYTESALMEVPNELNVWEPREGTNINAAATALILLTS